MSTGEASKSSEGHKHVGRWAMMLVLWAIDPRYAVQFFASNGKLGFLMLGGVVLAITGVEALYADMGHFGLGPIRTTWLAVVWVPMAAGATYALIRAGRAEARMRDIEPEIAGLERLTEALARAPGQ